ncbi:MAG: amidase family protein, partial [Acidimicrobiales bacterium]
MTTALALAAQVRAGSVTATTVVDRHLAAIDETDGAVHAFLTVLHADARRQAQAVDATVAAGGDPGPLAGVPVALKDNLCTRGVPTTCSSRLLDGWLPPYDATVVTRLRAAGAV